MHYVDLLFRGHEHVIATGVIEGRDGLALVDPGPSSCLPMLESGLVAAGYRLADVRAILLTHIHLDHAGAAGTLARRLPEAVVCVHERGARHMADPAKLLASATRLYGDQMDTLWGAFEPVPAERLKVVSGDGPIDVVGRTLEVAYTPGHAVHHVSYFDATDGVAYVGDTCGIRVSHDFLIAPTPPPDIDVETWFRSLDVIDAWNAGRLFLTHFGPVSPPGRHLQRFRETLRASAAAVRHTLERDGTDDDRVAMFVERMRAETRRAMPESDAVATELAAPFPQLWHGLARYWRKRTEGQA